MHLSIMYIVWTVISQQRPSTDNIFKIIAQYLLTLFRMASYKLSHIYNITNIYHI